MPSMPIRLMLTAGLCFASTDAMAQALQWQVSESAGAGPIRHGATDRAAARGAVLEPGDTVSTGANGRAVLVHERDFVTLAPRSRTSVPVAEQASGFTKLLQDLGNAVYKIEKRGVPHFGVTTPYLAAVVKGTTFSVTVDASGTSLQVVEGAVEVATSDGGARDLIRPGSVATIGAADRFRLRVQGDEDRVVDSPARPRTGAAVPNAAPAAAATPANDRSAAAGAPAVAPEPLAATAPTTDVVIAAAITSKPADLGQLSGGLMTGTASVGMLTASVAQAARTTTGAATASLPAAAPAIASAAPAVVAAAVSPTVSTTPVPAVVIATVASPASTSPAPVVVASIATSPAVTPVVIAPVAVTPAAAPVVTTPAVVIAAVTTPVVTAPVVAIPAVTIPVVSAPVVATPVTVIAAVTTPTVSAPVVTIPAIVATIIATVVNAAPIVTKPVVVLDDLIGDDKGNGKGNNGNHYGSQKNGKGG